MGYEPRVVTYMKEKAHSFVQQVRSSLCSHCCGFISESTVAVRCGDCLAEYCSETCREEDADDGHWLECISGGKLGKQMQRRFIQGRDSLLWLCLAALRSIVVKALKKSDTFLQSLTEEYSVFSSQFPLDVQLQVLSSLASSGVSYEMFSVQRANDGDNHDDHDDHDEEEEANEGEEDVDEMRSMYLGIVQHELRQRSRLPTGLDFDDFVSAVKATFSSVTFLDLYARVKLHHVELVLESPHIASARRLYTAGGPNAATCSAEERIELYRRLRASADALDRVPRSQASSSTANISDIEGDVDVDRSPQASALLEREICHFAQRATSPDGEINPFLSLGAGGASACIIALVPSAASVGFCHSCNPSHGPAVVALSDDAPRALLVTMAPLRQVDTAPEFVPTRHFHGLCSSSSSSSSAPATRPRAHAMHVLGGRACLHCELSSTWTRILSDAGPPQPLMQQQLKLVAFGLLAGQNYQQAATLLGGLAGSGWRDADALHAWGAALLPLGRWRQAHAVWKQAALEFPLHAGLRAASERVVAYCPPTDDPAPEAEAEAAVEGKGEGEGEESGYHSLSLREAGRLRQPRPLLLLSKDRLASREECLWVIQEAEDHASGQGQGQGWTTARHYAVPTTDVPVSSLPRVLSWFRALVHRRLQPMLARHFFPHLNPALVSVVIHDAFVVRYSHGAQNHLPLHQDESSHSVTMALNDDSDYDGGGTYFEALGGAVRPPAGNALVFDGQLVHGGDPITKGTRYIIAAFLFCEVPSEPGSDVLCQGQGQGVKRRRVGATDQEDAPAFSFGFDFD